MSPEKGSQRAKSQEVVTNGQSLVGLRDVPKLNPSSPNHIHIVYHFTGYAGSAKILRSPFVSDQMGLLDQLWDDTVAESDGGSVRSHSDETPEEATRVTRSIMIVKPPGYQTGSPPVSPAGSTPPVSPFSGGRESFRFRRRSISDAYEKANEVGSRRPRPPYDV
ncbi:pescadillo-like protein [Hibiscus syriacus]|uniref:Pescadillo-like protein n=1 Tax=Hibiscus syriacus TaxID=106335 RepID=A0A6A2YFI9_HIBSY|nr:pescadillo-like protein [Hibiscus syriacus]